jgi:hypothetical protein
MDEMRELRRVPDKEHRRIVEHPIPIAFLRPQLDRKPTRVTRGVRRAALTTDGGETDGRAGASADFGEELGAGEVGDVVCDFEVAVCAGAFGVDDALGDALAVEVGEEVDVVEVCASLSSLGGGSH